MQRVRKLLAKSPRAAKLSLGKWTWSAENPLPNLDTILKEEWADLRFALARPVKETGVTATDGEKSTTIWLNKPRMGTKQLELGQRQLRWFLARLFRIRLQ